MSAFSNESCSHYRCAEATLPFRAVAQRLLMGGFFMGVFVSRVVGCFRRWFLVFGCL